MSELEWFNKKYSSSNSKQIRTRNNALGYSRVSSKEQAENNMSLETQIKQIRQYANKNNFNLIKEFGGTYESAKTDERKQFKEMIDFALNSKNEVDAIIVSNVDRFSRSGPASMIKIRELVEKKIKIISTSQNFDVETPNGLFHSDFYLLLSN